MTNPLHRLYLFVIMCVALFFEKNNDNKRRKKRGIDYEEEIDCRFTGRCDGSISVGLWCIKDRRGSGSRQFCSRGDRRGRTGNFKCICSCIHD